MKTIFAIIICGSMLLSGCGPEIRNLSKLNVENRMEVHHVPGVSVALINDFQIERTLEFGLRKTRSQDSIHPGTLFQTASIGKPVIAAAVLQLVEERSFSLDAPVNQYLSSWKVQDNSFTDRTPVTIRQLLSHTAGVNLPGVIGYRVGDSLPELDQILNGEPPANTPPIMVDQVPGVAYKYSSGGFMILQKLLMDHAQPGHTFPDIIKERIFTPAGMRESSFKYPPESSPGGIASGHRGNGEALKGNWYVYPEMGMGVFWTTPSDMARFIIQIMHAYNGQSGLLLSTEMVRIMTSPQVDGQGLGLPIDNDGKNRFYFFHRGATEGYQTYLVGYPERGQGAVIMTNSDTGYPLIKEILEVVSKEYHWLKGIYL